MVSTAAFHARVRGSVPGLGGLKETKLFLPHPRVKVSIVGSLRDREVACSASDRQGSNFESCVWRTVSSQSSHHPQEVLLAQFSLYVHKGGIKPDSFHFPLTLHGREIRCYGLSVVESTVLLRWPVYAAYCLFALLALHSPVAISQISTLTGESGTSVAVRGLWWVVPENNATLCPATFSCPITHRL